MEVSGAGASHCGVDPTKAEGVEPEHEEGASEEGGGPRRERRCAGIGGDWNVDSIDAPKPDAGRTGTVGRGFEHKRPTGVTHREAGGRGCGEGSTSDEPAAVAAGTGPRRRLKCAGSGVGGGAGRSQERWWRSGGVGEGRGLLERGKMVYGWLE